MSVWAIIYLPIMVAVWCARWLPAHRAAADHLEADQALWEHHQVLAGRPPVAEQEEAA